MASSASYRKRMKEAGLCQVGCGRESESGKTLCRPCLDKAAAYVSGERKRHAAEGLCQRGCGQPTVPGSKAHCEAHVRTQQVYNANSRARASGIPAELSVDDVEWPTHCPVPYCGVKLDRRNTKTSPSLDRLIPELGYVRGNVVVVCQGCNARWGDQNIGTAYEVADWRYSMVQKGGFGHLVDTPRKRARKRVRANGEDAQMRLL